MRSWPMWLMLAACSDGLPEAGQPCRRADLRCAAGLQCRTSRGGLTVCTEPGDAPSPCPCGDDVCDHYSRTERGCFPLR